MRERIVVICPTRQANAPAADWHDGQFAHRAHAGFAWRAIGVRDTHLAPSIRDELVAEPSAFASKQTRAGLATASTRSRMGRVEMWRGGFRLHISVGRLFRLAVP
jgi:hypothetical protein